MLPFIRLGPFFLQAPGLALLVGVWLGTWFAETEARRLGLNPANVSNLIYYGLIAGLLGARLTYASRFLNAYVANPWGLLTLTPATLDINAGLLIGTAVAILFGRRWKLSLRLTLDALAPGLAVFMIALGCAHFLSGDAFGAPARLPWSVYLWDDYRHPSQIYETLAALGIFLLVWKRPLDPAHKGLNFVFLVALSAAQEDAQSVGYIALFLGGVLAYLGAEVTLAPRPHPIHWLTAGIGAITTGGLAYGLTLWRGTRRHK